MLKIIKQNPTEYEEFLDLEPIQGPMNLNQIPKSKLYYPLTKLENFVAETDSEIITNPTFLDLYLKTTQHFNSMLQPNTEENIQKGKYFYDSQKLKEFLSVIE